MPQCTRDSRIFPSADNMSSMLIALNTSASSDMSRTLPCHWLILFVFDCVLKANLMLKIIHKYKEELLPVDGSTATQLSQV